MSIEIPDPYGHILPEQWFKGYAKRRSLAKKIAGIPGAFWMISVAGAVLSRIARINALAQMVKRDAAQERFLRGYNVDQSANPIDYDSGFGYSEEAEDIGWQTDMVKDLRHGAKSKHRPVFDEGLHEIKRLIEIVSPTRVVNFGVSYPYIEQLLASQFQGVQFVGIERSKEVIKYNQKHFDEPGLTFVAADIMEWIDAQDSLEDTLFVSMRTLVLMPESFVRAYFTKLAAKKVAGIYAAETYGLSRETDKVYLMDYEYKPSVHYRDGMYLHNYPEILTSVELNVIRAEYVDVPYRDEDQRMFSISATR